jgi:hypothetical protein
MDSGERMASCPLTDFKPTQRADPRQQILEELREIREILSTEETAAATERTDR